METPEQPAETTYETNNIKQEGVGFFKLRWVTIITIVALIIGGSAFYSVSQFVANTEAIRESCRVRNENIAHLNYKINQLNILVDARLRDRPDGSPNPPDVVAAADALKEPIPLTSCEGL